MEGDIHTAIEVLELTTVHYRPGDPFSLFFAYVTLIPLALLVSLFTLILFRRDFRTALIFVGLLVNEVVNYILKKMVKQSRPSVLKMRETDYGMPSSHAQFLFFFSTYLFLLLLSNKFSFYHKWWKQVYSVLGYVVAAAVAYSRVYLYYHTAEQVLVGCAIGTVIGGIWFFITEQLLSPLFPYLENLPIARYFYVRDTSEIGNLMRFEYENIQKWKREHPRKATKGSNHGSKSKSSEQENHVNRKKLKQ